MLLGELGGGDKLALQNELGSGVPVSDIQYPANQPRRAVVKKPLVTPRLQGRASDQTLKISFPMEQPQSAQLEPQHNQSLHEHTGQQGTEAIFSASQERVFSPTVLSNENVHTALGYQQTETSQEALLTGLQGFFSKTVTEVNNPRAWAPGEPRTISDERRAELPLPETHILQQEDGSYSYEFVLSSGLRIITGSQENQDGLSYPIEHVLSGSDTGQLLDLMSFRTRENVPYSFSFSGVLPLGGSEVFLSMDTLQENGKYVGWDTNDFKYRFVHEDGHASLPEEYYQPRQFESRAAMHARYERDANAIALQKTRRLNTVYPQAGFFDLAEHREWIEDQMKHRYDDLSHVAYQKRFDVADAASNEKRKEAKTRERKEFQASLANELILDETGIRVQDIKGK